MTKVNLTLDDIARCHMAKTILEKEYARNTNIYFLARRVGTNENKLKISFKLVYKKTIHAFVTWLRIERAKELLEGTDLPIEMIAYNLGLDHSNLIKQFKRHTGITPKEWRNSKRDFNNGYAV